MVLKTVHDAAVEKNAGIIFLGEIGNNCSECFLIFDGVEVEAMSMRLKAEPSMKTDSMRSTRKDCCDG